VRRPVLSDESYNERTVPKATRPEIYAGSDKFSGLRYTFGKLIVARVFGNGPATFIVRLQIDSVNSPKVDSPERDIDHNPLFSLPVMPQKAVSRRQLSGGSSLWMKEELRNSCEFLCVRWCERLVARNIARPCKKEQNL
jgi:hypothetical protein